MGMKRVPILEASAAQLREHARDVLGMQDVKDNAPKATLLALIQQAWNQDHVVVSDVVDDTMAARRTMKSMFAEETADNHPATVIVHVNIESEPGGDRDVETSVNGKNFLIPRGRDVEIPWAYYIALQNAEQYFYDPMPVEIGRSNGGINPVPRKVKRYPFSRVA